MRRKKQRPRQYQRQKGEGMYNGCHPWIITCVSPLFNKYIKHFTVTEWDIFYSTFSGKLGMGLNRNIFYNHFTTLKYFD